MHNHITLIGRLVRKPKLSYTPTGVPVATFPLAVNRSYQSSSGKTEADFFDIVAWRNSAEFVAEHLDKGRLVLIDGSMLTRSYETSAGQKRKVYEVSTSQVVALDRKPQVAAEDEMGTEVHPDADELPF
jgi:single-strand DNA-binding protein